ncbi:YheC/YheD family protein [Bacillus taeanensis]|uniref:YheC/YheD family protein n=1 Tax=Bacillus taeanensis TaxID=273032 RepID=A0A366XSJ1_9BACI|nr:YheC/YheD family protein [Bacillus taeanensis]RBW69350.1 YheC/YheD family protein [Bacillus taeanensis]
MPSNSLGIIVLRSDQEKAYFNEMGDAADEYGMNLYTFLPEAIDLKEKIITGKRYDQSKQTWINERFPIPTFIYDRCFYSTRHLYKRNYPIVQWLKNEAVFLGHGLPNKWAVYQSLKKSPFISYMLPLTVRIKNPKEVVNLLNLKHKIVLKPESGSQGKGIFFFWYKDRIPVCQTHINGCIQTHTFQSLKEFQEWLKKRLSKTKYIAQDFLSLLNEKQQPFDIRILIQKNENGQWVERGRGLRVGKKGSLISNIHNGGIIHKFEHWFYSLPFWKQAKVHQQIENIKTFVPSLLEKKFGPLFEVGIDIGVDEQGHVWLLEVNSKPGHQVVLQTNLKIKPVIYRAPLAYCRYLWKLRS